MIEQQHTAALEGLENRAAIRTLDEGRDAHHLMNELGLVSLDKARAVIGRAVLAQRDEKNTTQGAA